MRPEVFEPCAHSPWWTTHNPIQQLQDGAQVRHDHYLPPNRAECVERNFYQPVDEDDSLRIDVRTWADERQLVDFSLMALVLWRVGDEWQWSEIARVDICHGHAHAHILTDPEPPPIHIKRIDTVDDVHDAFRKAITELSRIAHTLASRKELGT